jgi:GH15 family glucan-1,4-alpha-glucosidase
MFLDEPDNVYKYAKLIFENGEDTKDAERLRKDADEIKAKLSKTGVNIRHFYPDDFYPE